MTMKDGGGFALQLGIGFLEMAVSFTTLKTRWSYFMEYGSFRWYTIDPTCLFTVNGPSLQYNSFMDG